MNFTSNFTVFLKKNNSINRIDLGKDYSINQDYFPQNTETFNISFTKDNYLSDDYFDESKDYFVMKVSSDGTSDCIDAELFMRYTGDLSSRPDVVIISYIIYAILFLLGLLCNGLLIGSMVIRKRKSVANIFLINLAIADILLCFTTLAITPLVSHKKVWLLGAFICKIISPCQSICVLVTSYSLCFIALDRYRSIVTPMKEPYSIFQAQIFMIFMWFSSIIISIPSFVTSGLKVISSDAATLCGEFCGELYWPSPQIQTGYGVTLVFVQFIIPSVVMGFCYWHILQKVREDWIVNKGSMLTQAQQAQTAIRKKRVMYVLIMMVFVFLGSWAPLTLCNMARDFGVQLTERYFITLCANIIAMTSIITNPMLYFWLSKRHRRALKDDMFWLTNVRRNQQNIGILDQFEPSSLLYKKNYDPLTLSSFNHTNRRGTLADPTSNTRDDKLEDVKAACFLLVPIMPFCKEKRLSNTGLRRGSNNSNNPQYTTRNNMYGNNLAVKNGRTGW
uniref:G_PROTEIN_RECEP_F1_2 domain-containing protein n=1 Tax=Strongyloides stercoralis TaxID=6248 RepID=A0AAF5CTT6_STRER